LGIRQEDAPGRQAPRTNAGKTKTGGGAADPAAIGHHGHAAQFQDVLKAIKAGKKPLIDGRKDDDPWRSFWRLQGRGNRTRRAPAAEQRSCLESAQAIGALEFVQDSLAIPEFDRKKWPSRDVTRCGLGLRIHLVRIIHGPKQA